MYVGVGDYRGQNWDWEFYPPPYSPPVHLLSAAGAPALPIVYSAKPAGCGCGCGGGCSKSGLGLFESGLDVSQWGVGEWSTAGIGLYLMASLLGDLGRAKRTVQKKARRVRRAAGV